VLYYTYTETNGAEMIEMYNKIETLKEQVNALRLELGRQYPQEYNTVLKQALGLAVHELNHALAIVQYNIDQECA
jgi:hypothetical protein